MALPSCAASPSLNADVGGKADLFCNTKLCVFLNNFVGDVDSMWKLDVTTSALNESIKCCMNGNYK